MDPDQMLVQPCIILVHAVGYWAAQLPTVMLRSCTNMKTSFFWIIHLLNITQVTAKVN